PLELLAGQQTLIEQGQPIVRPANGRDGGGHDTEARPGPKRISAVVRRATRRSFSRPRVPWAIGTAEGRRRSVVASSAARASLARPSTGGAATRTLSVPSARQPTISLRPARGWMRTRSRSSFTEHSSGRLARIVLGLGVEQALVP